MKLTDKAYKEISFIISNETIYSPKQIYNELIFLQYDLKRLLNCIDIAMNLNTHLPAITSFTQDDIKRRLKELNIKEV